MSILTLIGQALLTALGMAWQVLWSLVLGFLISGMIQAYVSRAGIVLVAIVALLVKLTYPEKIVEEGRAFHEIGICGRSFVQVRVGFTSPTMWQWTGL